MKPGGDIVELGSLTISEAEYIYDFSFPEEGGKPNPHLWTDPTLARRYAEIVKDDMSERDPAERRLLRGQLRRCSPQLIDELDAAMRTSFATDPEA